MVFRALKAEVVELLIVFDDEVLEQLVMFELVEGVVDSNDLAAMMGCNERDWPELVDAT